MRFGAAEAKIIALGSMTWRWSKTITYRRPWEHGPSLRRSSAFVVVSKLYVGGALLLNPARNSNRSSGSRRSLQKNCHALQGSGDPDRSQGSHELDSYQASLRDTGSIAWLCKGS